MYTYTKAQTSQVLSKAYTTLGKLRLIAIESPIHLQVDFCTSLICNSSDSEHIEADTSDITQYNVAVRI